jgi:thiol-disulfide isomerase/thioredoxin
MVNYLHEMVSTRSNEAVNPKKLLHSLKKHGNSIVIFYADWCGPCKRSAPIIEELASLLPDFTIIKINYDQFKSIAQKYIEKHGMRGIPSFLFFKEGKLIKLYSEGPKTAEEWVTYINELYELS